jgi:hypothetical protein
MAVEQKALPIPEAPQFEELPASFGLLGPTWAGVPAALPVESGKRSPERRPDAA